MAKNDLKTSKNGYQYRPARLVISKNSAGNPDLSRSWYVVYYIYSEVTGKLERQRKEGEINAAKTINDRKSIGKKLAEDINTLLANDYIINKPGAELEEEVESDPANAHLPFDVTRRTLLDGFVYFKEVYFSSILPGTQKGYNSLFRALFEWFEQKEKEDGKNWLNLIFIEFNVHVANAFFDYLKNEKEVKFKGEKKKGVSNKTFNNYLTYFATFYNFFIDRSLLAVHQNPLARFNKKNTETNQHTPFTNKQIQLIKAKMLEKKAHQLLTFVQFLYYTFGRPGKEVRLLQVKDIRAKTIFFPASRAKNATGAHVGIPPELELIIQENNYREYPPHYYIFTLKGKPGPEPVGINYFPRNHAKILELVGITEPDYSLYGYKHTGNINLYNATKDLKAVQRQNRHKTSAQTDTYLRALGLLQDEDPIINFPKFGGEDPENKKANDL
ncbi:hypothetical protein HUW51_17200 [Adhaeribacter swui]|uniref:Site-specific integrase n=1 Tax=Adhaeribacter swui TaxID=2086471 RepID=A0A7G7GB41_9BACT|nr:hypothetical protein [Adhaeribacter swui]QNF34375.1 hypothetical protein HUW51_17200 [Adhaeribacter swui]